MFYRVKILNKHGKLLNTLTSEALSKRHWGLFEEQLKPSSGKKNKFNEFKLASAIAYCDVLGH